MPIKNLVAAQRAYFNTNRTKDISFRREALEKLLVAIEEHEPAIYEALEKDLGKCAHESYMTEVGQVKGAIRFAIKNLYNWSKPQRRKTPLSHFPASSYVVKEPFGVTLILSPWNYPFFLSMSPLVGAVAAGNCVVLKMSRNSINTSNVIASLLNTAFSSNHVCTLDVNTDYSEILSLEYDYIFFTGSERVGRIVMRHASESLTPVTLELGGKSPCIIDENVDLNMAAKKIAWGKILNSGQTCVAPDYCVVPASLHDEFITLLQKHFKEMVPDALNNPEYGRIVNLHHFVRLQKAIDNCSNVVGGSYDDRKLKIEPSIFPNASFEDDIMRSEIFGPILPVIPYDDLEEIIAIIKHRPKPLACYIFGNSSSFQKKIVHELSFGGGCINNTVVHVANENIPFGGVGASGMGKYHGKDSFDTFSHDKSILKSAKKALPFMYPPYTSEKKSLTSLFLR